MLLLFLTQELFIIDMSDKKPFVLRIDPEKLKALEKWAADEFRSTNGQIEYILDQALRKSGRWKTGSENNSSESSGKERRE
jgi:hypothetical protein